MAPKAHDLSPEEEKRLSELFDRLDVDKDGRIDVNDLTEALHLLEIPVIPGQAQVVAPACFLFFSLISCVLKSDAIPL